jgi:hypothetical protein
MKSKIINLKSRILEMSKKNKKEKSDKKDDIENKYKPMSFTIDPDQVKKLKKWQGHIKAVYGEYGDYEYRFTSSGIGPIVIVYSELAKVELDLTDVSTW